MSKIITIIGLILAAAPARGGDVLFKTDFNNGIPKEIELVNNDNMAVNQTDYNHMSPESTWFAENIYGTDGYAAVSVSRRIPADSPTDNWLILPGVHVPSGKACIQWKARSVHHDLPDGYSVMISEGDYTQFKAVLTVEEEAYGWTTRVLPLAEYEGKDIRIAFCHNSTNRFAIAIDDIRVGEPEGYSVTARNESPHFIGSANEAKLKFNITNTGRRIDLKNIILEIENGETYTTPCRKSLDTGEEMTAECSMPVETGKSYAYKAWLEAEDGTKTELPGDILTCSYYPRVMLVEKFTGTWCNSCPSAIPLINRVKDRLGGEAAVIEVHGNTKKLDPMSCDQYGISVGVQNYPTVMFNRETTQQNYYDLDHYLETAMASVTNGMVEATAQWTQDGRISIDTKTQFAEDLDNSSDRYRIGILVKEKHIDNKEQGYTQKNNSSSLKDQEYSYMPGTLTGELISFHDVARCGDTDEEVKALGILNGIRNTLPQTIRAYTDYEKSITADIPENVINKDELAVIVTLFNSTKVINAAVINEISSPAGVSGARNEESGISITACGDGHKAVLPASAPYRMAVYRADGTCVSAKSGNGNTCEIDNGKTLPPGLYIVRITQGKAGTNGKILVK